MAIENVPLYIPDSIQKGIDSGIYTRIGGVIRKVGTMELVLHLKEAVPADEARRATKAVGWVAKKGPVTAGIVTTAVVSATAIGYAANLRRRSKRPDTKVREYNPWSPPRRPDVNTEPPGHTAKD